MANWALLQPSVTSRQSQGTPTLLTHPFRTHPSALLLLHSTWLQAILRMHMALPSSWNALPLLVCRANYLSLCRMWLRHHLLLEMRQTHQSRTHCFTQGSFTKCGTCTLGLSSSVPACLSTGLQDWPSPFFATPPSVHCLTQSNSEKYLLNWKAMLNRIGWLVAIVSPTLDYSWVHCPHMTKTAFLNVMNCDQQRPERTITKTKW